MSSKATFHQIVIALAPRNIRTLEGKAFAASALATACAEHGDFFRAIESDALHQIFQIITSTPQVERRAAGVAEGRPAPVLTPIVCSERGSR